MTLTQITKIRGPGIHTTSNIVSHNINSSGIITATAFSGPFTGSSNIQSGIITATQLDLNGNGDISGNLNVGGTLDVDGHTNLDNISVAGVATFTGDATFSGNVSIGGTLTYEDVTNIDSVGLITARSGVYYGPAGSGTLVQGNGTGIGIGGVTPTRELTIYSPDSGSTYINLTNVTTGTTTSDGFGIGLGGDEDAKLWNYENTHMMFATNSEERLRITSAGLVGIGTNVGLTDILTVNDTNPKISMRDGGTERAFLHIDGSDDFIINNKSISNLIFKTQDVERLRIGSDGTITQNYANPTSSTTFIISKDGSGAAELRFDTATNNTASLYLGSDEQLRIRYGGTETVRFTSAGQVQINTDGGSGALTLGASQDFKLYHDAGGPTIFTDVGNQGLKLQIKELNLTEYTGNTTRLKIDSGGRLLVGHTSTVDTSTYNSKIQVMADDAEASITVGRFGDNASATALNFSKSRNGTIGNHGSGELHDNDVIGNIFWWGSDGGDYEEVARIGAEAEAAFTTSSTPGALTFHTTASGATAATERLRITSGGGVKFISADSPTSTTEPAQWLNHSGGMQLYASSGSSTHRNIIFCSASNAASERLRITSAGNLKLPDDAKIQIGGVQTTSGDLEIYHTASGTSWIRHYNTSEYFVIEGNQIDFRDYTNAHYRVRMGAAVELRHNNIERFKTSSTGVTVTGEVAASQDYPNYRPTLDLNFAAVKKLDPRITFTRFGLASYVDEFGIVKLVAANAPRFDHDPITGESKGLLIEEGRSNYVLDSTMLTGWSYGVGTDAFTASSGSQLSANPDGSSPAYHYVPSSFSGYHRYNETVTVPTLNTEYVISVFVKRVTTGSVSTLNRYVELESTGDFNGNSSGTGQSGSNGGSHVVYDLQNLTVHPGQSDNDRGYVGGAKIENYGNGWYRCSYVFNPGSGSYSTGTIWWGHPSATAGDSGNEQGNGNPSFYFWGASVEKGSFLTSYIPTNGSTVSRGADIVLLDDIENEMGYNQLEGTLVLSASYTGDIRGSAIVVIDDTSNESEYTEVGYRSGGGGSGAVASYIRTDAGNDQYYKQYASSATQGNEFKVALAYKDDDYASSVNGQTVDTDTSGTTSKVYDRLRFSDVDTVGVQGAGYYRRFIYYPKRLPNSQLATLTA